jgi:hypothetical protein
MLLCCAEKDALGRIAAGQFSFLCMVGSIFTDLSAV